MKSSVVSTIALSVVVGVMAACGSNNSSNPDASGSDAAAQQSAQSADAAGASDNSAASAQPPAAFFMLNELDEVANAAAHAALTAVTTDFNATVSAYGCTDTITGAYSDANGIRTLNANMTYANCGANLDITGTASVNATLNSTTGLLSRTVQTTVDLTWKFGNALSVTVSSLNPSLGWTYDVQAQGIPAQGTVTLNAQINQHRVGVDGNGKVLFDHNLTTDANGIAITNDFNSLVTPATPSARVINSGTLTLHHNLAKFAGSHTFANLHHDLTGTCACPDSGQLTQVITMDDGSGSFTRAYTFTGCGTANVTTSASTLKGTSNGSASVTWSNCRQ